VVWAWFVWQVGQVGVAGAVARVRDHSTYLWGEEPVGSCRWDGTFVWCVRRIVGGRIAGTLTALDGDPPDVV